MNVRLFLIQEREKEKQNKQPISWTPIFQRVVYCNVQRPKPLLSTIKISCVPYTTCELIFLSSLVTT